MNGHISCDRDSVDGRYPSNTTATFTCNNGYSVYGHDSRTCETLALNSLMFFLEVLHVSSTLLLIYLIPNHKHIKGTTQSSSKAFGGAQPKELSHLA